jgi:hypothetical protein
MPWAESCSLNGRQDEEESQKCFCSLSQDSPFRSAGHFPLLMNHPCNCQISSESAHLISQIYKLRDKSDPKMRAWEKECRSHPYYQGKESLEAVEERVVGKIMGRYQDYQGKIALQWLCSSIVAQSRGWVHGGPDA